MTDLIRGSRNQTDDRSPPGDKIPTSNDSDSVWQRLLEAAVALRVVHERGETHGTLARMSSSWSHASGPLSHSCDHNSNRMSTTDKDDKNNNSNSVNDENDINNDNQHQDPESVRWRSPESLRGETSAKTLASDVFAFDMCVIEAVSGEVPWGKVSSGVVRVLRSIDRLPKRPEKNMNDEQWSWRCACVRAIREGDRRWRRWWRR